LDLLPIADNRIVYSNSGGTWVFATNYTFTADWLNNGPNFTGPYAYRYAGFEITGKIVSASATPEPSSLVLFGIGTSIMGLAAARRRRREKSLGFVGKLVFPCKVAFGQNMC
jgi:putative lipase involved disintegration of autophagic bodies